MFKIIAEDMNNNLEKIIDLEFKDAMAARIAEEIIKKGYTRSKNIYFSYYIKTSETSDMWVRVYSLEEYE